MYHVSSKRHVIMIHLWWSQVFVFESGGRHFTKHSTLVIKSSCPALSSLSRKYLQSRPFLLQSAGQCTGYCWFNDITSDDGGWPAWGDRSRDPVLPCFVSSRLSCWLLGRPHCTAATSSSGQVVFQTLIICHRHGDSDVALPAFAFPSWPGIKLQLLHLQNILRILQKMHSNMSTKLIEQITQYSPFT